MFYLYLLQNSVTKEKYFGYTANLKERLATHNAKGKKFTTRKNGIWKLVYCEAYASEKDARQRELKIKQHGSAKHELYKRLEHSLENEPKTGAGRS